MNKVQKFVLIIFTMAITSILMTIGNHAFAVKYSNYTSEKYGIQFDYPTDWTVTEKTSRFDDGSDIGITSPKLGGVMMSIDYKDAVSLLGTLDIEDATKSMIPDLKRSLLGYEVRIVEEPHLITIDNKTAGTVIIAAEEKYEDPPIKMANQLWVVIIGSKAFLINYIDNPKEFDSPTNTEIRDHFIKSIAFLGNPEPQQTSRFD
jgi:hypothetical protein